MIRQEIISFDKKILSVAEWNSATEIKGLVIMIHSRGEHSGRMSNVAEFLSGRGYFVVAPDLRSHGKTDENLGCGNSEIYVDCVKDIAMISKIYKEKFEQLPLALIGHGTGSFFVLSAMERYEDLAQAYVFSAVPKFNNLMFLLNLAKFNVFTSGETKKSKMLNKIFNGGKKCRDKSVISTIEEQNQTYSLDQLCGFEYDNAYILSFLNGVSDAFKSKNLQRINAKTPIFIPAGNFDALGGNGKYPKKLKKIFEKLDFCDVRMKLYEGKHDYFLDSEKNDAQSDLASFLDNNLKVLK